MMLVRLTLVTLKAALVLAKRFYIFFAYCLCFIFHSLFVQQLAGLYRK